MTDTLTVLKEARALVAKGWTQGAYMRAADGENVWPNYKRAVCFCVMGAISLAAAPYESLDDEDEPNPIRYMAAKALINANDIQCTISEWNDAPERTQAEVLAAFDKAIEAESAN